jgi:acetyl-CoA C-acetyltransferase
MAVQTSDVIITGIGSTEVGEHWDLSLRELALQAIQEALQDSCGIRPAALFVGNMLAPILSGQAHLGALLADYAGMRGIEAVSVEAGGASGGAALRHGFTAVASGLVDAAPRQPWLCSVICINITLRTIPLLDSRLQLMPMP